MHLTSPRLAAGLLGAVAETRSGDGSGVQGSKRGRGKRSEWGGASRAKRAAGERSERRVFKKGGINECPFHSAFWLAEAVGDVVAGPLGITAPVGACRGSAEGQRRAASEHGPRTAERLTCRCVYFCDTTLFGLVCATDGRRRSALQLVLAREDGEGKRRAAAALARAPTSVCRNDTSGPDGAMPSSPVRKSQGFFFWRIS